MARKSRRSAGAAPGDGHPVTVTDVARQAGVSPITVSRALHRPELVSAATRERVLEVVSRMGYRPNLLAGSLATSRSHLIAILLPTVANSIYANVIHAIMDRLTEAGYQSLIGPTGYSAEKEQALLEAIIGRRPDGIVLTGTLHTAACRERLANAGIPVVEAWDLSDDPLDIQVGFSHEAVGQTVGAHFLKKGCRRQGLISVDDPRARRRNQGLARALLDAGARPASEVILPLPSTWEVGRKGFAVMLAEHPTPPDLVFCSSDTVALGVIAEASSRGLRVPEDVRVLGFGDTQNGRFAWPPLSTVSVNSEAMGEQVARALLRRLIGQPTETRVDTGFELIERAST
ncbi:MULTISPECIES: LacI family DNA-binding transcriptional regulator [unclassified Pseudomonas]|uniref:LacI family DNA-binding transcriptional regulator n=1 Tax=unclassified Pseudomonas TaxID=196821 RepID=UPI000BD4EE1A|nr:MULTISPECIES: LacI family DNA-binding transcriptional regulator [unclassified Pseudomonas]PVZ16310.1 LacI family transcriptional regulator [Pseudomonas sp. URIL14HWK12:I12]PVZ36642.1 LacI family transcriptional regulator [Pseudomonas sp. URIL14HWK12:I11]SNZ12922.1 transcriptional regulator, LacI family [Pseudomonas sp. URIL14HWK12:I9]